MSVTILGGDCRDVLATLPAESVQCCVTSFFVDNSAILRYKEGMAKDTRIQKGQHLSAATEFKAGEHWRPHGQHRDKDWLEHQYVTLERSAGDIGREVGCTDAAIFFWLRRHEIPRRSIGQAREIKRWGACGPANGMHGRTGALNPRYIDGSSPERQRLYVQGAGRAFLNAILERDAYQCQRCGKSKAQPRSLHVHHVTPWAGNPTLRFESHNVVTLCAGCHRWVHSKKNTEREFLA